MQQTEDEYEHGILMERLGVAERRAEEVATHEANTFAKLTQRIAELEQVRRCWFSNAFPRSPQTFSLTFESNPL